MLNIVKVTRTFINNGRRKIQVLRNGKDDVRTPFHTSSPQVDSPPINGMRAIYGRTQTDGNPVVIGYILDKPVAEPGECRLTAIDENGNEQGYIYLKGDGTAELLGNSDNLVSFNQLEIQFNELNTKFNLLVAAFNAHVHNIILPIPATPTTVPIPTGLLPSTAIIALAKISRLKSVSP